MHDPYHDHIKSGIAAVEEIVRELPRISSRRELKVKSDEILRLIERIRINANLLHVALENERRTISPASHGHVTQPRKEKN